MERQNNFESMVNSAEDLLKKKDYKSAVPEVRALIDKAREIDPDNPIVDARLAQVELAERNYDRAQELAVKAISMDPAVPRANFVLGQCKMAQLIKSRNRSEKRALYHEAQKYYEEEKKVSEDFKVSHEELARLLNRGRLICEAHSQSVQAFKAGQRRIRMGLLFLITSIFIWLGVLIFLITSLLLTGFFSDVVSFTVSIPIAVAVILLSFLMTNSKWRVLALITFLALEVLFVILAGVFWRGYRTNSFLGPRTSIECRCAYGRENAIGCKQVFNESAR